jgi:hypothetical protein
LRSRIQVLYTCGRLPVRWQWQRQWLRLKVLHPFHVCVHQSFFLML